MARIRNPRYAPEFLERRLNPSTFALTGTYVEVARMLSEPEIKVEQPVLQEPKDPEAPLERDDNYNPIPEPAPFSIPGLIYPS